MDTLQANWVVFAVAAAAVLLLGWWLLRRSAKTSRQREYKPDVLDEGVGPAQRNQALIDAKPAADVVLPPAASSALGGVGEVVAVSAQDLVEELEDRAAEMEVVPEVEPAPEPEVAKAAPPPPPPPVEVPEPEPVVTPEPEPDPEPEPEVAPEPEQKSEAPAAEVSGADDLSRIKGLGPKLQALLPELGITTFAQIAALTEADLADLDPKLGPFAGRPARDGWVEQAKYLAAGDVTGFEARFGKM